MLAVPVSGLEDWRERARSLLAQDFPPEEVVFHDCAQGSLFSPPTAPSLPAPPPSAQRLPVKIPRQFLELAADVACHRHARRWPLLYRVLYRLTHGERHLLQIDVDPDVRELCLMQKAVKRDIHKMHAFVRFRKVEQAEPEQFVAWHRPDHYIVERVGPWFAGRFGAMRWTILTPDRSAQWDTCELTYGP